LRDEEHLSEQYFCLLFSIILNVLEQTLHTMLFLFFLLDSACFLFWHILEQYFEFLPVDFGLK